MTTTNRRFSLTARLNRVQLICVYCGYLEPVSSPAYNSPHFSGGINFRARVRTHTLTNTHTPNTHHTHTHIRTTHASTYHTHYTRTHTPHTHTHIQTTQTNSHTHTHECYKQQYHSETLGLSILTQIYVLQVIVIESYRWFEGRSELTELLTSASEYLVKSARL